MQLHVQTAQGRLIHAHAFKAVQGTNTGDSLVFGNDGSKTADLLSRGIGPKFGKDILEGSERLDTHFAPPVLRSVLKEI